MGKLEGKVALVTGSGRNIGRATVLKLAGEGAHVVVNARSNQGEADTVAGEARERGVKALSIIADVAKQDQVDAMVARALSEFGRIDILINNAAIRPHKPFTEVTGRRSEESCSMERCTARGRSSPRWSRTAMGASCSSLAKAPSPGAADGFMCRRRKWAWSGSRV